MKSGSLNLSSLPKFLSPIARRWRRQFYILLALTPLAVGAISFAALLNSPYLGLSFELKNNKWFISAITPGSPAAQHPELVGKEIVAIGSAKIGAPDLTFSLDNLKTRGDLDSFYAAQDHLASAIQIGHPVTLAVRDELTMKEFIVVPSTMAPLKALVQSGVFLLTAATFLLLGLLVVLKKPEDRLAQLYFLTGAMIAANMAALTPFGKVFASGLLHQWLYFIVVFTNLFATSTMFHFFATFPKDSIGLNRNRYLLALLYLLPAIVLGLFWTRLVYSTYSIFVTGAILLGVCVLARNYRRLNAEEKAQAKLVIYGISLFLFIDLFLAMLPLLFFGHRLMGLEQIGLAVLLLPVSMALAIMKYGLMDIDTLFDNTLIYAITLGILALVDFGVLSLLTNLKLISFTLNQPLSILIGVWVIIFAYLPVRNQVQKMIRRLLKRESYDAKEVALELGSKLLSATTVPMVFEKLTEVLGKTLYPKGGHAFLLGEAGAIPLWPGSVADLPVIQSKKVEKAKTPLPLSGVSENLPSGFGGGVYVPIEGTAGSLGYILLQEKHSDRLYDREDLKLLSIISGQAGIAIEAIRAKEDGLREKERISREIHDGIGSSFVKAIMISEMIGPEASEEANRYHKDLKKTLSEGLAELRTLVWTVDESQNTLQDLVLQIQEHIQGLKNKGTVTYRFHRKVMDDDLMIPPLLRRNIIRIVNESLTNIIKYAEATLVDITFLYDGEKLILTIRDNGKGFDEKAVVKGYGLRNIRKRCEEMGGELVVDSRPGGGTEIVVKLRLAGMAQVT